MTRRYRTGALIKGAQHSSFFLNEVEAFVPRNWWRQIVWQMRLEDAVNAERRRILAASVPRRNYVAEHRVRRAFPAYRLGFSAAGYRTEAELFAGIVASIDDPPDLDDLDPADTLDVVLAYTLNALGVPRTHFARISQ